MSTSHQAYHGEGIKLYDADASIIHSYYYCYPEEQQNNKMSTSTISTTTTPGVVNEQHQPQQQQIQNCTPKEEQHIQMNDDAVVAAYTEPRTIAMFDVDDSIVYSVHNKSCQEEQPRTAKPTTTTQGDDIELQKQQQQQQQQQEVCPPSKENQHVSEMLIAKQKMVDIPPIENVVTAETLSSDDDVSTIGSGTVGGAMMKRNNQLNHNVPTPPNMNFATWQDYFINCTEGNMNAMSANGAEAEAGAIVAARAQEEISSTSQSLTESDDAERQQQGGIFKKRIEASYKSSASTSSSFSRSNSIKFFYFVSLVCLIILMAIVITLSVGLVKLRNANISSGGSGSDINSNYSSNDNGDIDCSSINMIRKSNGECYFFNDGDNNNEDGSNNPDQVAGGEQDANNTSVSLDELVPLFTPEHDDATMDLKSRVPSPAPRSSPSAPAPAPAPIFENNPNNIPEITIVSEPTLPSRIP